MLLLKLLFLCTLAAVIPSTCAMGKGVSSISIVLSVSLSDLAGFPTVGKQEAIYRSDTTVASQSANVSILINMTVQC